MRRMSFIVPDTKIKTITVTEDMWNGDWYDIGVFDGIQSQRYCVVCQGLEHGNSFVMHFTSPVIPVDIGNALDGTESGYDEDADTLVSGGGYDSYSLNIVNGIVFVGPGIFEL